jgi:hypothetical protein
VVWGLFIIIIGVSGRELSPILKWEGFAFIAVLINLTIEENIKLLY